MAIKAKEILNIARYSLSDTAKERWSDERLLILLNDGLLDIAKNTTLFVENMFYEVPNLIVDIDLSSTVLKVVRAEYLDEPLPFFSFDEMDKKSRTWQLDKGEEVEALVYDKQKNGLLKQYPIVENAQNSHIVYSGDYGIITKITTSDIEPNVTGTLGDLAGVPDTAMIKFYYIRRHAKVTDINTELNIDEMVEQPLVRYIVAMAFRDNQDAQNRQLSVEELQLYSAMISNYSLAKEQNYVRVGYSVAYNPNGMV